MKNIRQDFDELRPEYTRADFNGSVRGKHAFAQLEIAEFVRLLIACIGEDEGLQFSKHTCGDSPSGRKSGDWTYEIDNANQITLRYWLDDSTSIEEPMSNSHSATTTPHERAELQALLTKHVQNLKSRTIALNPPSSA